MSDLTPEERFRIYAEEKAKLTDKRKSRTIAVIFGLVIIGILLFVFSDSPSTTGIPASGPFAGRQYVVYQVSGSAEHVTIHYDNGKGGTDVVKAFLEAGHPWSKGVEMPPGSSAYITAQNDTQFGSVTVSIEVDGKNKTAESSGPYCIASLAY